MTKRWIAASAGLIAVAGVTAALGWRWPTMLAAVLALGLAALLPAGSLVVRAGLLAVAAAILTEVSAWRGLPAGTDVIALVTDPVRQREQLVRGVVVAALLIGACLLFAVAVLRRTGPGLPPAVVAPLLVGGVLLGTRTWLAVETVSWTLPAPPSAEGDHVAVAVAVDTGPDVFGGLIVVAALAGAVLLCYACTGLGRRAPA
ncbi:hypothetical protein [Actinoplanes aureus]|uniref:Uncharacterized protein n=1 Tax=Actinoplanes aureus TaxID=2792083 RepID=A0A931CC63_9ACTN|nr:hypothetical protein [Actinoplanes aureus]MBG0565969.1 hypothetical protein [Actinoplanes aureus]